MRGRTVLFLAAGAAAAAALIIWSVPSLGEPGQNVLPSPNSPAQPISRLRGRRVLLVGDSLAVGLTPRIKQRATSAQVAAFASDSETGTTIGQWASGRFQSALAAARPDVVLVSLGTNDAAMEDVRRVPERIAAILASARAAGATVFWIGPPSLPARLKNAAAVRQMIRDGGPTVYYDSEASDPFERSKDGIHATASGYASWADSIWSALEQSEA